MKYIIAIMVALATLVSCGNDHDERARMMLTDARIALAAKQYKAAEDTVLVMRKRYPRALGIRREALLLLDSIRMEGALDSLQWATDDTEKERLATKAKFFQRRLKRDAEVVKK